RCNRLGLHRTVRAVREPNAAVAPPRRRQGCRPKEIARRDPRQMSVQNETSTAIAVSAQHVSKSFGSGEDEVTIIEDLNLDVAFGDVTCLVGPSGVGKTTLLRLLGGLAAPTSGSVSMNGVEVTGPVAEMAVVFQDYRGSM